MDRIGIVKFAAGLLIGAAGFYAWQAHRTTREPGTAAPTTVVLGCQDFVRNLATEVHITGTSAAIVHFIDDPVSGSPPHSGTVTASEFGYVIALPGGGECRTNQKNERLECIDRDRAYWFQGWCRQGTPSFQQ